MVELAFARDHRYRPRRQGDPRQCRGEAWQAKSGRCEWDIGQRCPARFVCLLDRRRSMARGLRLCGPGPAKAVAAGRSASSRPSQRCRCQRIPGRPRFRLFGGSGIRARATSLLKLKRVLPGGREGRAASTRAARTLRPQVRLRSARRTGRGENLESSFPPAPARENPVQ
jgi:hypothetical protein